MAQFIKDSLILDYSYIQQEPNKPVVLFIHGFGVDRRIWEPQVDYFTKQGYNILTYDMRGFGDSSDPDTPYSHHRDLHDLLGNLKIDETHLVGLSFGGEVAIDMTLAYPDKVKSLSLLAPSIGGYMGDPQSPLSRWVEMKRSGEDEKLLSEVFEYELLTELNTSDREFIYEQLEEYFTKHFGINDQREKLSPPAIEKISEIKCPISILIGSKDSEYQKEIAETLHREVSSSTLLIIDGVGHFVNVEAVDQVNEILVSYSV